MDILQQINSKLVEERKNLSPVPNFIAGDTLKVNVKVVEGGKERTQAYEGLCIARSNNSISSAFTVRKLSYGEGVERVFPLYSPNITIEVVKRGKVRRAKLYYLRGRTGKAARIQQKDQFKSAAN